MITAEEKNRKLEEELNKARIQIEELKNENEKLLSILRNLNRKDSEDISIVTVTEHTAVLKMLKQSDAGIMPEGGS